MTDDGNSLQARFERARRTIAERESRALSGWERHPAFERLAQQRAMLDALGQPVPYGRPHASVSTDRIDVDGRALLNFSGYNYLGLSGHPEVSAAAKAAIDRYGTSASASRLASGETLLHGELEAALAALLGTEACLVFVSGYGTNVTTIGHLFGPNDVVLHDALAHSSVLVGAQLSGARRIPFPHNDAVALERLLSAERARHERALVVVEGVYSMDGDIAPLDRLVDVKRRYDALLMVDEAHSLGVLGARGRGAGEHFGLAAGDVDIWMGTLSKTLAAAGGYIAGTSALVDVLRYSAPGYVYSVGLSPADTAAALAALRVLEREPERVARLRSAADAFRTSAREHGIDTGAGSSAVVPAIVGDSITALRLADALLAAGICVHPVFAPAVEEGRARLRFFITALHDPGEVSAAAATVATHLRALRARV